MQNTLVDSCTLGMAVSDVRVVYLIKLSDTLCIETYFHSVPKGEMVLANLIFPILNPHWQLCKCCPTFDCIRI